MDYELELEIWSQAHRSMSAHLFGQMVTEAVESYQRMPGHSELERVYVSNVGTAGFEVLVAALEKRGIRKPGDDEVFISMRAPLRRHIYQALQWHLMTLLLASNSVMDDQLARDLGL
jgi:hypothetical protein